MRFIDLTGQTFGKLTVIRLDHMHKKNGAYWQCSCNCGSNKVSIISGKNIRQKKVLSCGCLIQENGHKNRDDLLGKTFGNLTVFNFEINDRHNLIWLCNCSCGSNKVVRTIGTSLKNGDVKSCGCIRRNRLAFGENAFNRLYDTYRRRALKKDFPFSLSKEEFKIITSQNCFYCGIEPKQKAPCSNTRFYGDYIYNGIDRIDSSKGYTQDNVVPCCGQCNVAKNNHSYEKFLNWVEKIHNNFSFIKIHKDSENLKL